MKRYLMLSLIMGIAAGAGSDLWGHLGDRIYPIWQLSDEEVAEIDLGDGSVEDWIDVVGQPTLLTSDFWTRTGDYDPSDLDFRIWLAWHETNGRIYVGMERFDDAYVRYENSFDCISPYCHDAALNLFVDGDHSGGDYQFPIGAFDTTEEVFFYSDQQAQWFTVYTETFEEALPVELWYSSSLSRETWFAETPYAQAGGRIFGENPTVSILEFYVTPFDRLIKNSEDESAVSQLRPGQVIGFDIRVYDNDIEPRTYPDEAYSLGLDTGTADSFFDGLLLGGTPSMDSAVESKTWARIKASFAR
jgi:hypothetical protein